MGMFDTLRVDKKWLPEEIQDAEDGWQTKSLDSMLGNYSLTEEGTLMLTETLGGGVESPEPKSHTGEVRF